MGTLYYNLQSFTHRYIIFLKLCYYLVPIGDFSFCEERGEGWNYKYLNLANMGWRIGVWNHSSHLIFQTEDLCHFPKARRGGGGGVELFKLSN